MLADLLDMKDERWHKAVEGYLGSNKLTLIVEPKYIKDAMKSIVIWIRRNTGEFRLQTHKRLISRT